eukprot:scaffold49346_cov16-Prasinocladus_malaysianus.AAC.2
MLSHGIIQHSSGCDGSDLHFAGLVAQELEMARQYSKPIMVLVLDQEGWDLLTVPGGAEKAKHEADRCQLQDAAVQTAWEETAYGTSLRAYAGELIV